MSLVRRLTRALPSGTLPAGAGVSILGIASYVHLAVAGHRLPEAELANLSVLWSVVYAVGYGVFQPVEQELTRVVAGRRTRGVGSVLAWRRAIVVTAAFATVLGAIMLLAFPSLAALLFVDDDAFVGVAFAGLLGIAIAAPVRGQLAGAGRFDLYGGLLGLDGLLRIVLVVGVALIVPRSAAAYGLVLLVAPLLTTLVFYRPARATTGPAGLAGPAGLGGLGGPTPPAAAEATLSWSEFGRGVGPLLVSSLLSQFMFNAVVVSARVIAEEQTALVSALLAALILVRVPTVVFSAVQASLLSGLAAAAHSDRREFFRLLRHTGTIVSAMMAVGGAVFAAAGPWLVHTLFGVPDVLTWVACLLLALGTWAYLLALVLGQGVMTLGRHHLQTIAWVVGAVMLVVVTVIPGDIMIRLTAAYLVGNLGVAATMGGFLVTVVRSRVRLGHDPAPA